MENILIPIEVTKSVRKAITGKFPSVTRNTIYNSLQDKTKSPLSTEIREFAIKEMAKLNKTEKLENQ